MLSLTPLFPVGARAPLRILCVGAHSDDIEIGCGGLLLEALAAGPCEVLWVVFSAPGPRRAEARSSARSFLAGAAASTILIRSFRESFFPVQWSAIKREFEALRRRFEPDVVFTHFRDDRHQDHRVLSDLAWNTFRNHLVFEYEIPKYDGDLGRPSAYFPVSRPALDRKLELLLQHFGTQRSKHWFDRDTFAGLMRLRGIECASPSGFAEAFHARKWTLSFGGLR